MEKELINLEEIIREHKDIAEICMGRMSTYLLQSEKNYCCLKKGNLNIYCSKLYNYSNFPNACLYEGKTNKIVKLIELEK